MLLRAFFIITFVLCACMMAYLGYQWIYEGFGLTPWISFPLAAVLYFIPFYVLAREANALDVELADLLDYINQGKDDVHHATKRPSN